MKKLIIKPSLFLKSNEEKAKIEKIKEAWKEDNFIVIPSEFSYKVVDNNVDILEQAKEEIQELLYEEVIIDNTTGEPTELTEKGEGLNMALDIVNKLIESEE